MSENTGEKNPRNLAKKTHEMLVGLSTKDSLTGLFNRKGWDQEVRRTQKVSERTHQQFSFLVIDLDKFKEINDKSGHEKGDEILVRFSNFLKGQVRSIDSIARYGGDEFTVLMPATDIGGAEKVKTKLIESGKATGIEFSIGSGITFEEADKAMYKMKNQSNNPNV